MRIKLPLTGYLPGPGSRDIWAPQIITMRNILIILSAMITSTVFGQTDSLDQYVSRLKQSKISGGSETAFMSLGSDFLYAQEYLEAGNFSSAESSFRSILYSHKDHPYTNYQFAVALLKQNDPYKTKQAQEFLEIAFRREPSLKARFSKDFPEAGSVIKSHTGPGKETLETFIERIKYSRATGGKDTEMLSAGLEAFYGIEYYERNEFRSAESRFRLSLAKDASDPYVNYMLAVSLHAMGKAREASLFLNKATAQDQSLASRFSKDAARAANSWKRSQAATAVYSSGSTPAKTGGKLVFGNYTCHVTVWNGPNTSPAYRYDYKGYFELKSNGTYRWLDNGATGKYSYDEKSGNITWLSGYFKGAAPGETQYRTDPKVPQITVTYSDNYRWECGCKK